MTVMDMLDQFEIQGALKIQRWSEEKNDMEIFYDSDNHENELVNRDYWWLNAEIQYMFPATTYSHNIEVPQIVIEIEADE